MACVIIPFPSERTQLYGEAKVNRKTPDDLTALGYMVIAYDSCGRYGKHNPNPDFFYALLRKDRRFFSYIWRNDHMGNYDEFRPENVHSAHSHYRTHGPRTGRLVSHDIAFPNYERYQYDPKMKPRIPLEEIPEEFIGTNA